MECNSISENKTKSIFALLPVEVWWIVLDQVQNPSDLWSCFHANKDWKSILKSRNATWTSMQLYKILPLIYTLLSANDLLKLRLVSRKWKKSVDIFLEHQQINQPTRIWRFSEVYEDLKLCSVLHSQKVKLNFKKRANNMPSKTVLDFQLEMDQYVRHPAILHTICVTDYCWQNSRPAFQDLTPFFKQYGVYISNLCLHFRHTPAAEFLMCLQNFLNNTPNLKSLSIAEHLEAPASFLCSIENISLPLLPELLRLEIDAEHTVLRNFMFENLLVQNVQHFANISLLNIGINCDNDLITLKRSSCAVKELHLNIEEYSNVCFEHVLSTVEHFSKSLRILKISRAPPVHEPQQNLAEIQLPNLETLSLINMHQIFPHLLLFGNLENLQLLTVHCLEEPCNQDETEEYFPNSVWYCEKTEAELLMGTSKLWKQFANLNLVELSQFEGDIQLFHRRQCEKLRQNLCALKHILDTAEMRVTCTLRPLPESALDLLFDPHPYRRLPYAPLVIAILLAGAWELFGVTGFLVVALLWAFVHSEAITYENNLLTENYRFHSFSLYDDLL